MKNKLKIAAIVVAVIAGIVLYKNHWEKNHKDDDRDDDDGELKPKAKARGEKSRWN
jgi:hypothetical protein